MLCFTFRKKKEAAKMNKGGKTITQQTEPFIEKGNNEVCDKNDELTEKNVDLRGVKLFTANFCVLILLYSAAFSYSFGVIRMVEKKFGFSSLKTGKIIMLV